MPLVENGAFLHELGKLYEANRKSNTRAVWVTMKRMLPELKGLRGKKRKAESAVLNHEGESVCLVRANNGKKHYSTHVKSCDIGAFSASFASVVRLCIDSLPKPPKASAPPIDSQPE
eukprot:GHVS01103342.1.p1 GENE.GHVS01103342.1~~GHVS01103342.1.p1  ORF type:complete len:117 (+),score=8.60 GHVS01103342.1:43-393(+)